MHLRLHSDEFCARTALYLGVQTKKNEHKHYILIGLVMHCGDDRATTAISVPHAAGRANNGQE